MTNDEVFKLLRNMLADARDLFLNYIEDWDGDLSAVDLGIRAQLRDGPERYEKLRAAVSKIVPGEIVHLTDELRINYVLFRPEAQSRGFYAIGPFFTSAEEGAAAFRRKGALNSDALIMLLHRVPQKISLREALVTARYCLQYLFRLDDFHVRDVLFSAEAAKIDYTLDQEQIKERAKLVESNYEHERNLFTAIGQGNYRRALAEGQYFMRGSVRTSIPDHVRSTRSLMYAANTAFRLTAGEVGIHPILQDQISQRFAARIDTCVTMEQLESIYMEMIADYCSLCRSQAMPQCTPSMQKMLNFILLNLGGELTPEAVARGVGFSAVYVSRLFKEELGTTFTAYVTAQRVKSAQRLLSETQMPVHEIAAYVGIPDWNYFTKVFKKETGQTPTAWRAQAAKTGS